MVIDLNDIKPKVRDESDKYSWNLYRFLDKLFKEKDVGKYYKNQLNVCWLHRSRWDGEYKDLDLNHINLNQVIIIPNGLDNDRSFYSLRSILGQGKAERFYLPWSKDELTDITEWFFETYKKDGRCIFDREHSGWWQGSDDRFTYINNTRRCNWCGEWHKKEIHKEVIIKRREIWV